MPDWNTPQEQISVYNLYLGNMRTFRGTGKLTIQSDTVNESAVIKTYALFPDSLYFEIEGPLGINYAEVFLDSKSYAVYLPRDDLYYGGGIDSLDLHALLIDLGLTVTDFRSGELDPDEMRKEIFAFFTGGMPLDTVLRPVNAADSLRRETIFESAGTAPRIVHVFPAGNTDLSKSEVFDRDGRLRAEKTYRSYVTTGGIRMPRYSRIFFPVEHSRISVRYENIRINNDINPDIFRIEKR